MKILILFVFSIGLLSCQKSLKTETKYDDSLVLKLEIDSICIPLDSISLALYPSATFIYSTKHSTVMYAFNTKTWMIDVFDLNKKCLLSHIILEKEGVNGVSYVKNMQVLSPDSIVCFDDNGFLILDGTGNVLKREKMIFSDSDCVGNFDLGQFTQPFYDKNHEKVYGRFVTSKDPYPYPVEQPLFAEYDIRGGVWNFLPITLPPYMQKNWLQMGQNRNLNMWIDENRICYNFTCLSDVFVYSMSDKTKSIAGGESRILENDVTHYVGDLQNEKAKWEHWIDTPVFYTPIYDKYKDVYYRIQVSELNEHFSGVPTPYDKKIALAVFNKNLEMVSEFRLENYKFNFLFFGVDKEGFIVGGNNPRDVSIDYECLKLYRLRIC